MDFCPYLGERRPKINADALSQMERYELNQDGFGLSEGSLMGIWGILCKNDLLRGFGQPGHMTMVCT